MTEEDKRQQDAEMREKHNIRPDVLNYDDIVEMVPKLKGHRKLVERLLHWLKVDEVNAVHGRWCDTPGPDFVMHMVEEDFRLRLRVDGREVLDNMPDGRFITVSNHPFGALDGIVLIYLVTRRFPDFKVMVNMILNKISAMRPNFIAVDALSTDDPEKRKVSVNGIREAMRQIRDGHPLGFFPAGAMSKVDIHGHLEDREWQKSVIQIIGKAKVPVIPIFFHGSNSWWFNFLGHVCWPARSLRLPAEVFRKRGKELHISIGDPISVEDIAAHNSSPEELGRFLRSKTYALRSLR
ncbi:MAG: lysophospholipid acyltransferase family protein [Muribaculaceae bacterium]|nr:lysophospholipid acyltransferase family protein [Muribaculaceae bacterium]